MGAIASQITSPTIVYSTLYSDADQRKHQSSASLGFVWGIHRGPGSAGSIWWRHHDMFIFYRCQRKVLITNNTAVHVLLHHICEAEPLYNTIICSKIHKKEPTSRPLRCVWGVPCALLVWSKSCICHWCAICDIVVWTPCYRDFISCDVIEVSLQHHSNQMCR